MAVFMDRFTCIRTRVPRFLEPVYRQAFQAGRYRMLLRESKAAAAAAATKTTGSDAAAQEQQQQAESSAATQLEEEHALAALTFRWGDADELQAVVRRLHDAASARLMQVLVRDHRLLERLESLRTYFLHGRGDWLENFLEAAADTLARMGNAGQVRKYSLNVVLQAEVNKACGASDPYHGAVHFALSDYDLPEVVARIRKADPRMEQMVAATEHVRNSVRRSTGGPMASAAAAVRQDTRQVMGLMQLRVETDWLLSLVINAPLVAKLNIIFRLLLWCKLCERDLNEAWWRTGSPGASLALPAAISLRLKLLQFVRQYFFYAVHHVLDPAWHKMMEQIGSATGVRDVSAHTSAFCADAFRGLAIRNERAFTALTDILHLAQRFSELGRQPVARHDEVRRAALSARVSALDAKFSDMLRALGNPQAADYGRLVPLLSWLDFSGYYARSSVYRVQMGNAAHDALHAGADHHEQQAHVERRSRSMDEASLAGTTRPSSSASSVA
jgi:hypothetical protein